MSPLRDAVLLNHNKPRPAEQPNFGHEHPTNTFRQAGNAQRCRSAAVRAPELGNALAEPHSHRGPGAA